MIIDHLVLCFTFTALFYEHEKTLPCSKEPGIFCKVVLLEKEANRHCHIIHCILQLLTIFLGNLSWAISFCGGPVLATRSR